MEVVVSCLTGIGHNIANVLGYQVSFIGSAGRSWALYMLRCAG